MYYLGAVSIEPVKLTDRDVRDRPMRTLAPREPL